MSLLTICSSCDTILAADDMCWVVNSEERSHRGTYCESCYEQIFTDEGATMYQLKTGVPVKAAQFTGENFMELYNIVPRATSFSTTPREEISIAYWDREQDYSTSNFRSILRVKLEMNQWVVVDEAGPLVVSNENFHKRYERMNSGTT